MTITHAQYKAKRYVKNAPFIDADRNGDPQCVDEPKQYWRDVYGLELGSFNGSAAKADQRTFPNGVKLIPGPSVALKPGDTVIYGATNGNQHGHTGTVDEVFKDGYTLMEQCGSYINKGKVVKGISPRIRKITWATLIKEIRRRK